MMGCHVKPEQFFNLIFGYYDTYVDSAIIASAATGTNSQVLSTVPAGEIWVVNTIRGRNSTHDVRIYMDKVDGVHNPIVQDLVQTATMPSVIFNGQVVLKAGQYIRASWAGCTAGDALYVSATGYKMKLSQ